MKNGISVIFITRNREKDLEQTLETFRTMQKPKQFEIIVIDQNSEDNTGGMIADRFPEVVYKRLEQNLGVAGGRNLGAALAQYEYMVFVDDDAEFIKKNSLLQIGELFSSHPLTQILAFHIYDNSMALYEWPYPKDLQKGQHKDFYANMFIGCGHAIRKEFFHKVNGYSEDLFFWGEEIELCLKAMADNPKAILYSGGIDMIHRVTSKSRVTESGGRYYYKVRNRLAIIRRMYPAPYKQIYFIYYALGYGIKSIRIGETKQYAKALKEHDGIKMKQSSTLPLSGIHNYYGIFKKSLGD